MSLKLNNTRGRGGGGDEARIEELNCNHITVPFVFVYVLEKLIVSSATTPQ